MLLYLKQRLFFFSLVTGLYATDACPSHSLCHPKSLFALVILKNSDELPQILPSKQILVVHSVPTLHIIVGSAATLTLNPNQTDIFIFFNFFPEHPENHTTVDAQKSDEKETRPDQTLTPRMVYC